MYFHSLLSGIYNALKRSGALDDMINRGIEHLHVYGIDNVLTKSLDPAFLGVCIANKVECGNKVVWRANKGEKVGVSVSIDGRMSVLEYSEIPTNLAEAADSDGKLIFGAANICNHYMTVEFLLKKVLPTLSNSYHLATKKYLTWILLLAKLLSRIKIMDTSWKCLFLIYFLSQRNGLLWK